MNWQDAQSQKSKSVTAQTKSLELCGSSRSASLWLDAAQLLCGCLRDARRISAEPRIYRRKISEEVTDMPQVLSFIGWLLAGLSFIGWLLRQAYLYWLAPPEDSLWALQGCGGGGGSWRELETLPGWLGPAQIALSPVWEKYTPCFHLQSRGRKSSYSPSSPYFLCPVPPTSSPGHCFDLMTCFTIHLVDIWTHFGLKFLKVVKTNSDPGNTYTYVTTLTTCEFVLDHLRELWAWLYVSCTVFCDYRP